MKKLLFIISFILPCFFNSGGGVAYEHCEKVASAIVKTAPKDDSDRKQNFHSDAILPFQAGRISGENGGYAPAFRSNSTLRRPSVSQKHPFRIIKAGKIIDRQHFSVFQMTLHLFPSGFNSISRYVHIICQLLI